MSLDNTSHVAATGSEAGQDSRYSRIRLFLLALFFAFPVMGGLFSLIQVVRDGLGGVTGLTGVSDIALSADGQYLYATAFDDNALAVFTRDTATGELSFVEMFEDGEAGAFGLLGASSVTVSPDLGHLYATGEIDDTLVVFSRDATADELTFLAAEVKEDNVGGVVGLNGAADVTVSPDSLHIYVASRIDDAVAVFSRNSFNGVVTFVEAEFAGVALLDGARAVAVSPDNKHVYVAASVDDAIVTFERDLGTGQIDFVSQVVEGTDGVDGIDDTYDLVISPDGKHVYAVGRADDAVALFDRNSSTGALTFVSAWKDGVDGIDGLNGASAVAISPAGDRVVVAGEFDNAVAVFRRDPTSGELTYFETLRDGIDGVDGLAGVVALALTYDHGYAAGRDENAVAVFDVAICEGNEALGDSDTDGFCDDVDVCSGDDLTGDSDGDDVCDDLDVCDNFDDAIDDDGDGVPDLCDACDGDDMTGDSDDDGVCDDLDVCGLGPDGFDADSDGVPDACDICAGDDATGDTDGDGTCDNLDVCAGSDDALDADGDGVPDGCDVCTGDDASGDADNDGLCADVDCDDTDAGNVCLVFEDGFESGNLSAWSASTP